MQIHCIQKRRNKRFLEGIYCSDITHLEVTPDMQVPSLIRGLQLAINLKPLSQLKLNNLRSNIRLFRIFFSALPWWEILLAVFQVCKNTLGESIRYIICNLRKARNFSLLY